MAIELPTTLITHEMTKLCMYIALLIGEHGHLHPDIIMLVRHYLVVRK